MLGFCRFSSSSDLVAKGDSENQGRFEEEEPTVVKGKDFHLLSIAMLDECTCVWINLVELIKLLSCARYSAEGNERWVTKSRETRYKHITKKGWRATREIVFSGMRIHEEENNLTLNIAYCLDYLCLGFQIK